MSVNFNALSLLAWSEINLFANVSFFANRKQILSTFQICQLTHGHHAEHEIAIPIELVASIVSTLSSRNEGLQQDARLSFPNHVGTIKVLCDAYFARIEETKVDQREQSDRIENTQPAVQPRQLQSSSSSQSLRPQHVHYQEQVEEPHH